MMLHAADPGAYDSKDGFGDLDSDIDSDGVRTCHWSQWYSCTVAMTSPALLRFWRQDEERDWNSFDQNGLLRPTRPDMEVCVHVCIYTILERLALTLYLHPITKKQQHCGYRVEGHTSTTLPSERLGWRAAALWHRQAPAVVWLRLR